MPEDDEYPDPPTSPPSIEPAELKRRLEGGEPVRLLDVRDRDEVEAWRVDGPSATVTHVPLSRVLQAQVTDGVADLADEIAGEGPITAVCAEGEASDYAAGLLVDAGVEAHNLAGGMASWARLYQAREVASDPTVVQYLRPSSGCLAYVVRSGDEAVVIDPLRAFVDRYVDDAEAAGVDVVAAVDTHVHADHVSGLRGVARTADARRIVPAGALDRGLAFDAETVEDGDAIRVGDATLRTVALPGHTTEMTGFAAGDVLLTGDSLFLDGVARPDLQEGGDPAAMARRLHATLTDRLAAFGDGTVVAPGHVDEAATPGSDGTYTATLGRLRGDLPAFGVDASTFVDRITETVPPEPANAGRIVAVNLGAETVDDETALELELGPNNCAATWTG